MVTTSNEYLSEGIRGESYAAAHLNYCAVVAVLFHPHDVALGYAGYAHIAALVSGVFVVLDRRAEYSEHCKDGGKNCYITYCITVCKKGCFKYYINVCINVNKQLLLSVCIAACVSICTTVCNRPSIIVCITVYTA